MHSRWLKTRRHFYESLRQEIQMITGELSEDLVQYQNEYEKIFDKVWDVSSMDDLLTQMLSSKIILAGDFHYFYQSQRTHYRILRELKKKIDQTSSPQKINLLLEVFDYKDQKKIDDFLNSKIDFQSLLKKTKWNKKWNQLPSHGYEVLLNWAKLNQIVVYGINDSSLDQLSERDLFSGQKIDELNNKNQNSINYIIYGDFHLAEAHLPLNIQSYDETRDLILYLNSDKLYFALSEHAIEDQFDVLKIDNKFCILSSTPWVKLQSYLVYLQEMDDQMISEVEDDDGFEPDYTDYLGKILDIYASDFDFPDWKKHLDVLTPGDLAFEKLDFLKLNKLEKEKLGYFVTSQKNLVFPKDQMQFLAKPSVNSAYSLIGEFIHTQLSSRESLNWSGDLFMTKRIWIEAVSFFFNLWLNPTVKSLNESDLTARLRAVDPERLNESEGDNQDYAESVLRYAIDFRLTEVEKLSFKDRTMVAKSVNWNIELEAAGILGKIIGKKLYKSFKSGKINRETLLSYLSVPLESVKFETMYNHLLVELDKV
jgi:hypothetical protein